MSQVVLKLFGGFELAGGRPATLSKKAQALAAYLALGPGAPSRRGDLAALLWGDTAEEQARASLRQALSALRRALGPAALTIDTVAVALDRAVVAVDALAFRALLAEGTTSALEKAVSLYGGELLQGLRVNEAPFEDWLVAERERFREQTLDALGRLLDAAVASGAVDNAVALAGRLLAIEPAHEPTHRVLMRLHAARGQAPAARRQYQRCVDMLQRELGVEPERETKELYQALVRARAEPAPQTVSIAVATSSATASFVGRAAEQRCVGEALARALEGVAGVVAIVGEAGIGKSRLVARVTDPIIARGARVLIGQAYAAEQILPCGPWFGAFRNAGLVVPEGTDPARLVDSIVRAVDELTQTQPLALILEDLHWADELSQRVLAVVARRLAHRKLLIVVTVRDDELDDRPLLRTWLGELDREQRLTRVTLGPLARADIGDLVRGLGRLDGPRDVHETIAQVWAASEGHPLIAVETLRAMEAGSFTATGHGRATPERVASLIATRVERLSERARDVLTAASVVGRDFDFELVREAAAAGEAEAAAGIEELVRRRLVRAAGDRFEFAHDRIREVVYDGLLTPRRRLLHRRVAEALETRHAADVASHQAALGMHFNAAEAWAKAVRYLRGAGEWALARTANREAAACFEQAVAASRRQPDIGLAEGIDLRLDLIRALLRLGLRPRATPHLDEARRLAAELGDPLREGRIAAFGAFEALVKEPAAEIRRRAEQTRALGERAGDPTVTTIGTLALGYGALQAGAYREACAILGGLVATMDDTPHDRAAAQVLPYAGARMRLGEALLQLGDFTTAVAYQREAIAWAQRVGHGYTEAVGRLTYTDTLLLAGDPSAREELDRAVAFAREREAMWTLTMLQANVAWLTALEGRPAEAVSVARAAVADFEHRGSEFLRSALSIRCAETLLRGGEISEARTLAAQAVAASRSRTERGLEAWGLRLQAEIARRTGDLDAADATYRAALAQATALEMRPLVALCHAGLTALYEASGKGDDGARRL
ncbi:MAG: AAA family ATPase [Candidatus Rokubacteria bacterium]|nr:AAA family ATPase [Candidatus Rokubacteria bacterium]